MSTPPHVLQDSFLQSLRGQSVSVYLLNGVRLVGRIEAFDQYVVAIRSTGLQVVYKHGVSTIVAEAALAECGPDNRSPIMVAAQGETRPTRGTLKVRRR